MLKQWVGTSRYVYNNALSGVSNGEEINMMKLRDKYVTKTFNNDFGIYELFYNQKFSYVPKDWELQTPKDVRAGAIRDLCKAYKTCFSNYKNGNVRKFKVSFRTKKKTSSIEMAKSAIKYKTGERKISFYKNKIRLSNDKVLKKLTISRDCRLMYKRKKWYIVVPVPIKKVKSTIDLGCGIDPGVRKFVTVFGDDQITMVTYRKELLKKYQKKLDELQSSRDRGNISKPKYERGIGRVYDKMDNLVRDMHDKTISFLVSNYSTIFLPKFESQKLVLKMKSRVIRRNLFQFKHYDFRTRLQDRSELYGSNVIICTEEYTSKTCTRCGGLNNVGMSEIYSCQRCNIVLDRDVNGARNILLKNSN